MLILRQFRFGGISLSAGRPFVLHRNAYVAARRVQVASRWQRRRAAIRRRGLSTAANQFLSLAGKDDAELVAKVVFEINKSGVGVYVFGA